MRIKYYTSTSSRQSIIFTYNWIIALFHASSRKHYYSHVRETNPQITEILLHLYIKANYSIETLLTQHDPAQTIGFPWLHPKRLCIPHRVPYTQATIHLQYSAPIEAVGSQMRHTPVAFSYSVIVNYLAKKLTLSV